MKRHALALSAILLFAITTPLAVTKHDLGTAVGTWAVLGTNTDGTTHYKYEAVVTVADDGTGFATYLEAGMRVAGCGMLRLDKTVALACQPASVVILKMDNKNRMSGIWTTPVIQGTGTEVWTRISQLTPVTPEALEHPHVRAPQLQVGQEPRRLQL